MEIILIDKWNIYDSKKIVINDCVDVFDVILENTNKYNKFDFIVNNEVIKDVYKNGIFSNKLIKTISKIQNK